jgi:hypothetical protein
LWKTNIHVKIIAIKTWKCPAEEEEEEEEEESPKEVRVNRVSACKTCVTTF